MSVLAVRPLRAVLAAVSVACWVAVAVLGTLRLTVLDPRFDSAALTRVDAYNRLYTQVLPTPQVAALLRRELAGVPVDPAVVADNLPLLLPPATLQRAADVEIAQVTGYLLGDLPRLDLAPGVAPVEANLRRLFATAVANDLAGLPGGSRAGRVVLTGVDRALAEVAGGQVARVLPRLPLGEPLAGQAAVLLVDHAPRRLRPQLLAPVRAALEGGRLTVALSLVAPTLFGSGPESLAAGLRSADATLAEPLQRLRHRPALSLLRSLRPATSASDLLVVALVAALGCACLAGLVVSAGPGRRRRAAGVVLVVAGGAALVAGALLALTLPDPLSPLAASATLPGPARVLIHDLNSALAGGVGFVFGQFAFWPMLAGALILGGPRLLVALRRAGVGAGPALRRAARHLGPVRVAGAGAAFVALLSAAVVLPAATAGGAASLSCDGYAALCSRPYNQVAQLASHNATSSSADGFFGAEQDTDFVTQLNSGVRALLIDTHYWTAPRRLVGYLRLLPEGTADRLVPVTAELTAAHPGVWLCHDTCQQGATSAVAAFRRLAGWLRAHRGQVVTLIVQDHTDAADTMAAVRAGGLGRYLASPPSSPAGPWPTLGQLVRSGKRLYVFSERHDVAGSWYRSFYRYAAETRWDERSVSAMSCAAGRGPVRSGLFLLNDFVIAVAPSRLDAAVVNAPGFILRRAAACEQVRQMRPTFVAVDFTDIGGAMQAVDQLNRVGAYAPS